MQEFKNIEQKDKIMFYNQAYLSLNALDSHKAKEILNSTRVLDWFNENQKKVLAHIKNVKFQFYYDLRVLQIEDESTKVLKNYKLDSAEDIFNFLDLDDSLEGIICKGFILQPKTYEIIQLAKNL